MIQNNIAIVQWFSSRWLVLLLLFLCNIYGNSYFDDVPADLCARDYLDTVECPWERHRFRADNFAIRNVHNKDEMGPFPNSERPQQIRLLARILIYVKFFDFTSMIHWFQVMKFVHATRKTCLCDVFNPQCFCSRASKLKDGTRIMRENSVRPSESCDVILPNRKQTHYFPEYSINKQLYLSR